MNKKIFMALLGIAIMTSLGTASYLYYKSRPLPGQNKDTVALYRSCKKFLTDENAKDANICRITFSTNNFSMANTAAEVMEAFSGQIDKSSEERKNIGIKVHGRFCPGEAAPLSVKHFGGKEIVFPVKKYVAALEKDPELLTKNPSYALWTIASRCVFRCVDPLNMCQKRTD